MSPLKSTVSGNSSEASGAVIETLNEQESSFQSFVPRQLDFLCLFNPDLKFRDAKISSLQSQSTHCGTTKRSLDAIGLF